MSHRIPLPMTLLLALGASLEAASAPSRTVADSALEFSKSLSVPAYVQVSTSGYQAAQAYVEVPPRGDLGPPLDEADYPPVYPDRISDRREKPRRVYQEMDADELDDEPMAVIAHRELPQYSLPSPTLVAAASPSTLPARVVGGQLADEPELKGEARIQRLIEQELAGESSPAAQVEEADQGFRLRPLRRLVSPPSESL